MNTQNVLRALQAKGLKQWQIANKIGIAQNTVCLYSQGKRGVIRSIPFDVGMRLQKLAREYELDDDGQPLTPQSSSAPPVLLALEVEQGIAACEGGFFNSSTGQSHESQC